MYPLIFVLISLYPPSCGTIPSLNKIEKTALIARAYFLSSVSFEEKVQISSLFSPSSLI
jgi:hypothetical protein